MSRVLAFAMAICCTAAIAAHIPESGERVLVGDFEYVLVEAGDWARWTNAVARLEAVAERRWKKEHETVGGRRAWHGAETNRIISADSKTVTWQYADGYDYIEHMQKKAAARPPEQPRKRQTAPIRKLARTRMGYPKKLREKLEAIDAQPPAQEVTVTFGPGGKVIGEGVR